MDSSNVEDHGEWLSFGLTHAGKTIPVRISREAMEEFFGAASGPDSLKKAYELDAEMIHARAVDLVVAGVAYTPDNPLVLKVEDF
ncbi:hypothetical protein SAMN05216350_11734 [Polaromonas sp. YR568]|uniref:hypothetical protein n=1 Tax=Polaromonas sp. YR568 TaxID=1855301 RepID=UPI0008F044BA|nr:hypothetical protein [Polaromonas sp. YR568]SFV03723.1 hypothetical protein SAMN05216350_11734 [Polaromonas sp. YR568]